MKKISIAISVIILISCNSPQKEFEAIKGQNNVTLFNQFIEKYPENELAEKAEFLRDSLVFERIKITNNLDSLNWFVSNYPKSFYNKISEKLIDSLYFEDLIKKDSVELIENFLNVNPNSPFKEKAQEKIAEFKLKEILKDAVKIAHQSYNIKDNNQSAANYEKVSQKYLEGLSLKTDSSYLYEHAAYALLKASIKISEEAKLQFNKHAKTPAPSGLSLQAEIQNTFKFLEKFEKEIMLYRNKAIEYYKKAGMGKKANAIKEKQPIKNKVIEKEWGL